MICNNVQQAPVANLIDALFSTVNYDSRVVI